MQVTSQRNFNMERRAWTPRLWLGTIAVAGLAITFALDRSTGAAPVQHLYYLPIVLAGIVASFWGGLSAAVAAIVLYHLANPHLLTFRYDQMDVVQVVLFIAVGVLAAKVTNDGRRLQVLAMTDDLTGLHNLRSFEGRLARLVMESERTSASLAVFVLDVDHLKSLNDVHGHLVGAAAVRTIGHLIQRQIPPGATACRYGGDEFVVAVPGCDRTGARRLADDLRASVRALSPLLNGTTFPGGTLSISIGVACVSPKGCLRDPVHAGERFFAEADRALYMAKASGRDRVHLASGPPAPLTVVAPATNRATPA